MKIIAGILIVVCSSFCFSWQEIRWNSVNSYSLNNEDMAILNVVKNWASREYIDNSEIYEFDYAIYRLESSVKVTISPSYMNESGKKTYKIHGVMCLEINQELVIVEDYNCAYPPRRLIIKQQN